MTAAVQIRRFEFKQRWPWNGVVDIVVEVECPEGDMCALEFSGVDEDRLQPVQVTALAGDNVVAGQLQCPSSGTYRLTWDAAQDWPQGHAASFRLEAQVIPANYLLVNLANGTCRYAATLDEPSAPEYRQETLVLRRIPAGSAIIGSPEGEMGRFCDEEPHQITIHRPFYLAIFEFTRGQQQILAGEIIAPLDDPESALPVAHSNYEETLSLLRELSQRTGLSFTLPHEEQWEYACRGGTTSALNNGQELSDCQECAVLSAIAHVPQLPLESPTEELLPVGCFPPNPWGLYDMHGNAWEWCQGTISSEANSTPAAILPPQLGIQRGGYCSCGAQCSRSAARNLVILGTAAPRSGFRPMVLFPAP